jgi:hypothetical protein
VVGTDVAVSVHHFGFYSPNACRIVYLVHEEDIVKRFGFADGTLAEHAESGEERFTIEWNRADDTVWYDILALSEVEGRLSSHTSPTLAKIDSGALGGASGHHCLVFLFRLAGKKDPQGVDADRRSERNIEQRDEAEDERHDAGPGLALQQTPSRDESESSLTQNEYPNHAEQGMQEGRRSGSSSGREERVRDDIHNHAGNRIQGREGQPENP